jgi:hypothetical protein
VVPEEAAELMAVEVGLMEAVAVVTAAAVVVTLREEAATVVDSAAAVEGLATAHTRWRGLG